MDLLLFFYYHTRKKEQGYLAILRGFSGPRNGKISGASGGFAPWAPTSSPLGGLQRLPQLFKVMTVGHYVRAHDTHCTVPVPL